MIRIEVRSHFDLPVEKVFDAERDISLHARTQAHRGERPVDGITAGLIEAGQEVEWEAVHFGVRQRLRVRIAAINQAPGGGQLVVVDNWIAEVREKMRAGRK